jgi:hypothetical protein
MYFVAGSGAALHGASTGNGIRDVVADVTWQNPGTALHTGMLIPNEPPKVREGDCFMSQRPIDIADSGFVRFQIKNDDLWKRSVMPAFSTSSDAVIRCFLPWRAEPRFGVRENTPTEQSAASSASVPFDQRADSSFRSSSLYIAQAVVPATEQEPQPAANSEMTIKR